MTILPETFGWRLNGNTLANAKKVIPLMTSQEDDYERL